MLRRTNDYSIEIRKSLYAEFKCIEYKKTTKTISPNSKIWLFPRMIFEREKLKAWCKNNNVKIVKDINIADLIVMEHERFKEGRIFMGQGFFDKTAESNVFWMKKASPEFKVLEYISKEVENFKSKSIIDLKDVLSLVNEDYINLDAEKTLSLLEEFRSSHTREYALHKLSCVNFKTSHNLAKFLWMVIGIYNFNKRSADYQSLKKVFGMNPTGWNPARVSTEILKDLNDTKDSITKKEKEELLKINKIFVIEEINEIAKRFDYTIEKLELKPL